MHQEELTRLVRDARRILVFTGAGISTESGIPDFRSPGGVWTRNQPIDFRDFLRSEEARRETWRRKIETDRVVMHARPNRGHRAVARLVEEGRCAVVVTQNIDGLHQAAGVPAERVIELHGNATYAACLSCGERHELEPIKQAFAADGTLPECLRCGGLVKTATISFGQSMPAEAMARAGKAALDCDLFLAVGSSLVVYPAADFPVVARRNGATLVIVNRDPTPLDVVADLVLNTEIGETLGEIVGVD